MRGDSKVSGIVNFEQATEDGPTTISWEIKGNDPNSLRGFHIHEFGDSGGCATTGPHFDGGNGYPHAAPEAEKRHIGDLGNITTDADGLAKGTMQDLWVKLSGKNSVIGRAVVVHDGTDDLGEGGHENSKVNGNAGGRAACGTIGYTN